MPPKNVRTIRELIYWEYAKLISGSAVGDRKNYGFVMYTYNQLKNKLMNPSAILRENKKLVEEASDICAYCGCHQDLQWEHIIPRSRGGPDTIDNMVRCCKGCNCAKGDKDPFEWYGKEKKYEIPRLVLGKFLKLAFDAHDKMGTLDSGDLNADGSMDILDLGAVFKKAVAK
jgi:hypothetical protein